MRILMLGWEFPPFISGGLGTACYGLTRAMSKAGVDVLFVLPKTVPAEYSGHVRLISPRAPGSGAGGGAADEFASGGDSDYALDEFEHVRFRAVPSSMTSPYLTPMPGATRIGTSEPIDIDAMIARAGGVGGSGGALDPAVLRAALTAAGVSEHVDQSDRPSGGDMIAEAERYAASVVRMTRGERFDLIHAHDWMTYPAGLALARITGRPLVVHVHSTEFDRSGDHVHQRIYDIERRGMHLADRVIAVSELTRKMCIHRYAIDPAKIEVVYNGIDRREVEQGPLAKIVKGDKIVLFLGRITMQKGPEYFIAAAKKVLEKMANVKFVVAGSGDMAADMIRMAVEGGIGNKVLFTGFLRGADVERVFRLADVYVMPSVSEPFGIAPLEAIQNDVPVIISKNSGVAEVVAHALKVDFWDIDDMADKIVAVLRHSALSQTLRQEADIEVRKLTWDGAAGRCVEVYRDVLSERK